jgi:hypothetical protein
MTHLRIAFACALWPLAAHAENDSPWLPIPQQFSLTASVVDQSAKDAYIGSTKLPIATITGGAASKFTRTTTSLRVDYGFSDALALDATLSYARVKAGAADSDSGLADTVLGLRWRVLDEYESPGRPTLTLRAAAILKGDYEGARLAAIGNNENGIEVAAILGKQLTPAWALWGSVGVQDRSGGVPNATIYELGARWRFAKGWNTTLAYSGKEYGGNLDIGGPGFSPDRFQQVRAERQLVKLGVGYALAANHGVNLSLQSFVGDGRNTPRDNRIVGLTYTVGF